jgi:PHD/YefM family antitoxin component YafN of YafNO toxin-antitoxin module
MTLAVQYIVTRSGERLVVLPEDEYLMLMAASEDDEGELKPELLEELRRRIEAFEAGGKVVPMEALRKKS